jgi:hypothetical protein
LTAHGHEYVLHVKGNHPRLRAAIQAAHRPGATQQRGRWVGRTTAYGGPAAHLQAAWAGLAGYVVVEKWAVTEPAQVQGRSFITSLRQVPAAELAAGIRGHWGIENSLHRSRNVQFSQGRTRIRHPQASRTLALLITLALTRLLYQRALTR